MACIHKIFFLFIFILSAASASAVDLSKVNFSHLYQPNGIKLAYQVAKNDSLYSLSMAFTYERITELQKIDSLEIRCQEKFKSNKDFAVRVVDKNLALESNQELHIYQFTVESKYNYLIVKVYLNNLPYIYEIPINGSLTIAYPDFLTNPIHHTKIGDSIIFNSKSRIYGFEYHHDFKIALPPFVLKRSLDSTQKKLTIQNTHLINSSFVTSDSPNTLYLFQSDSNSIQGHRLITHKTNFPKTQTMEELIEPLIFISTRSEANIIANSENKKKAFENFWLNNSPDKTTATRTIKKYYNRVALSNMIFSTFKEGWKTDQGMILTIFGSPNKVSRKPNKEIWEYSTFKGDIKFTFAKQSNIFDQNYYLLERDEALTEVWFNEVKKWRNGDI